MAGYPANQDAMYISPDVQIPPGMTAYPMQPPRIPHQQQQQQLLDPLPLPQPGYPLIQAQHAPVYFMPPPLPQYPPQYTRHPAGPQTTYSPYPYPPPPHHQHPPQQQQQFNRNDGSTTVMMPVTFTPGMAPVIHSTSGALNNSRQLQQGPPSQQYFPPGASQQFSGGSAPAVSPRYLSMGPPPPPPSLQYPHQQQFAAAAPFPPSHYPAAAAAVAAVQMWPGGGPPAIPRMSPPPPPHPITHSGQDFQAAMPSGVTGPLHQPPQLQPQLRSSQLPPAAAAAGVVGRLPVEQSGDSAPHPHNIHGYKSQNGDLAGGVRPSVAAATAAAAGGDGGAAAGPSAALHTTQTAPAGALDALAEAAAASVPETSRASRSSARQQHLKTMKQTEGELAGGSGSGNKCDKRGNAKTARPIGNTSDALRKELGAALLGSDSNAHLLSHSNYALQAVEMAPPPPPQQQQQQQVALPPQQIQQPAVPSSVLQNLSRALADLSRMTAGTTTTTTHTAPRAGAPPAPMPTTSMYPLPSTSTFQLPSNTTGGHPVSHSLPRSFAPAHSIPSPSPLPYQMPPPPSVAGAVPRFNAPGQQQRQNGLPPLPMSIPPSHRPLPSSSTLPPPSAVANTANTAPAGNFPLGQPQKPATGPRLSRPLQIENPCFGPGVSFPGQLKRKRTNMNQPQTGRYAQKKNKTTSTAVAEGVGGARINSGLPAQQPLQHPYYLPTTSGRLDIRSIRPPPPLLASQQHQQQTMTTNRGNAPIANLNQQHASFPAAGNGSGGGGGITIQSQMTQMQQKPGGIILPSFLPLSNVPLPSARVSLERQQVPPPSPQPAPSRFQRSRVATTRAEPMVRIVRDISSASQLQRLQVDSKMERSLLLPPVPPPQLLLPISSAPPTTHRPSSTTITMPTTTTLTPPTTRGALSSGKSSSAAAAVAVALAVNASPSITKKKVLSSPKKLTTTSPASAIDDDDVAVDNKQRYPDEFTSLFKMNLTIIDESDQAWPVTYEGLACSGQRHLRLSSGWHAMMKGLGVLPGDKVVLERWTEDRTVLHMLVLEASEEQRAAAAAAAAAAAGGADDVAGAVGRLPSSSPLQKGGGDVVVRNTTRNRKNSKVVQLKTSVEEPSKRTRH